MKERCWAFAYNSSRPKLENFIASVNSFWEISTSAVLDYIFIYCRRVKFITHKLFSLKPPSNTFVTCPEVAYWGKKSKEFCVFALVPLLSAFWLPFVLSIKYHSMRVTTVFGMIYYMWRLPVVRIVSHTFCETMISKKRNIWMHHIMSSQSHSAGFSRGCKIIDQKEN